MTPAERRTALRSLLLEMSERLVDILEPEEQPEQWEVFDAIVRESARYFGIEWRALLSGNRRTDIVAARRVALYLARETMGLSFPALANKFGYDHTTVMAGHRFVSDILANREDLRHQGIKAAVLAISERMESKRVA